MTEEDSLVVVWSSGDKEVAVNMVFMYTLNSKKNDWWDEVTLIVWGPSSRLLAGDKELQEKIREMKETGVILEACKACVDRYGVSEKLESLGLEVKYMGVPLTEYAKQGKRIMTF
jgi:hypothetical protein